MTLDYFYGQSGELFSYFRIPKALFHDCRFRQLSTDARTLYGILLDRMSLSVKNGWLDEQGRVYIIYTVREVQESLCCAEHKAVKLFRELEQLDLIERKRRGLGRPSLIYVKDFSSGLPKAQVQNCPNSNSGAAESAILEQPKPQANKTDKNKTEWNDPDPMKNNATRTIRSEEITIDVRICAALAANRSGEVYLAAIAPDMELTVITLDEAPGILPCFEEDDACLNLPNTSLLLCYNPAQVLKMGGKHYLTGPVILVRTNMDGEVISLTIDEVYLFQKYLASHSITLMADDQKLPCICID